MLPKRRRARVATPGADSSAARFPGVAIYLAEPHMGRSRRAFLTRLALSKGFRVLDAYRCAGREPLPGGGDICLGEGGGRARRPRPRPREPGARARGSLRGGAGGSGGRCGGPPRDSAGDLPRSRAAFNS